MDSILYMSSIEEGHGAGSLAARASPQSPLLVWCGPGAEALRAVPAPRSGG